MKIVLVAVLVQAVPLPATQKDEAATAVISTPITAEYDDVAACLNAAKSIARADPGKFVAFTFSCAPRGISKLEVVPPTPPAKPKAAPQPIPPGSTAS